MPVQDKVAFITGANKGIGLETARGLGKLGIAVVSVAETRQTVGPPSTSSAPRASRRSSPSASTSPGQRIIKRSPAISRDDTASSTSWSTTRA